MKYESRCELTGKMESIIPWALSSNSVSVVATVEAWESLLVGRYLQSRYYSTATHREIRTGKDPADVLFPIPTPIVRVLATLETLQLSFLIQY